MAVKNLLLTLFVAFTLIAAPLAHAMDIDCANAASQTQVKDFSKSDTKLPKTEKQSHSCGCAHHIGDQMASASTQPSKQFTKSAKPGYDAAMTSVSYGPGLEPPTHA